MTRTISLSTAALASVLVLGSHSAHSTNVIRQFLNRSVTRQFAEAIQYVQNGSGTLRLTNGSVYVGEIRDGKPNGQGTMTYPDGQRYIGPFVDGRRHGRATVTFADGRKFVGEYRDDKRNGHGILTLGSGEKYVGEYRDGEKNGQGISYLASGDIQSSGTWVSGKFTVEATTPPPPGGTMPPNNDGNHASQPETTPRSVQASTRLPISPPADDGTQLRTDSYPVRDPRQQAVPGQQAIAPPEGSVDHSVGQPDAAQNITIVVANGLGSTVESAVQNAAQNALTQVVGSFVDAETQIERRTQITDGIRAEAHNISNKMREYSQGSIKSFEVLDTQQDAGIVRVTAKVTVQVDVLHAQLKSALAGATTVSKGLFAQAATEQTQQVNSEAIFIDRIVTPTLESIGLQLTVGAPTKMDMNKLEVQCPEYARESCGGLAFSYWRRNKNANDVYAIPVTLTADPGVGATMWQAASSTGKQACIRLDLNQSTSLYPLLAYDPLLKAVAKQMQLDGGRKMRYVTMLHREGKSSVGSACWQALYDVASFDAAITKLAAMAFEVSVLNKAGELLEQYLFHPYASPNYSSPPSSAAGSPDFKPPYSMIGNIFAFWPPTTQTFSLLVHLPLADIAQADHMAVKMITD